MSSEKFNDIVILIVATFIIFPASLFFVYCFCGGTLGVVIAMLLSRGLKQFCSELKKILER